MSTFATLAHTLTGLYTDRATLGTRLWQLERDLEKRRLELTPRDGWPGKNAELRDHERDLAYADDFDLQALLGQAAVTREKVAANAAAIEATEALRRAEEWDTRARLVAALDGHAITPNGRGDRTEAAFDDAGQYAVEREAQPGW